MSADKDTKTSQVHFSNNNVEIGEENTFSRLADYASGIYTTAKETALTASDEASKNISNLTSILYNPMSKPTNPVEIQAISAITQSTNANKVVPPLTPPKKVWFMNDPYKPVTGRSQLLPSHHLESVIAVRNLLQAVHLDAAANEDPYTETLSVLDNRSMEVIENSAGMRLGVPNRTGLESADESFVSIHSEDESHESSMDQSSRFMRIKSLANMGASFRIGGGVGKPKRNRKISKAETASRLGEGTIRAMRDIALGEALELRHALRFWTVRLERPLLYYLESGPQLWFSSQHDHHAVIGSKVSQLQAVLARRCSSIGELQQHLWRSGWQSGVEQWGALGQGEWAAVVGGHGDIDDSQHMFPNFNAEESSNGKRSSLFGSFRGNSRGKANKRGKQDYYSQTHLFVNHASGGQIIKNDEALAAWSIDAIRVVRDQLYSARNSLEPMPQYENWPRELRYFKKREKMKEVENEYGSESFGKRTGAEDKDSTPDLRKTIIGANVRNIFENDDDDDSDSIENEVLKNDERCLDIPLWATNNIGHENIFSGAGNEIDLTLTNSEATAEDNNHSSTLPPKEKNLYGDVVISDLGVMATEVTEILNCMENYMKVQRMRRLEKLKPPSRIVRSWYVAALAIPIGGYLAYNLTKENRGVQLAKEVYQQVVSFFVEHVSEPVKSIYVELFKGREEVIDHKAREDVISVLQKMIKAWLDEVHPDPAMNEIERVEKSTRMDMSLIESAKEQSVQSILEFNKIYRLSLIEMQFIKKEMMNTLFAMDELMGSNEINMKLAAMTPAVMLASFARYVFKKLWYAFLKMGKSKEETFASFRHIILDIERLLVMRDNPPPSLPPLPTGVNRLRLETDHSLATSNEQSSRSNVLTSDDLGMLMLLVHECRVILWQDRRRFTRSELRNVGEDLAELAGERGAVSVQQQLRIIARMSRTYSFLKIISSGIPFHVDV